MPDYRSKTTTHGRNMAGARALWRATGMTDDDFNKPIIAVVNSFTQFVPGHVHLKDIGQLVAKEIEKHGGVAKEFNTIAVDDGIAMGHDGMLYSLPSREIITDSVEYMINAHCADAMVCISNCDKITPGMLNAAMRLNIPTIFVSGGPMESGKAVINSQEVKLDLVDPMINAADDKVADEVVNIFEDLFNMNYAINKMKLVSDYKGNDWQSIEADNTSAFNCRPITGNKKKWSKHAYGKAIDINPIENPYISKKGYISHKASKKYRKRVHKDLSNLKDRAVLLKNDPATKAFKSYGWKWGGDWNTIKDYQHFVKK